jgi:iron complex transport system ATP-binding protein
MPRMVAAGPIDEAVSTATVSRAFDHPSCVERRDGHWTARAARRARAVG